MDYRILCRCGRRMAPDKRPGAPKGVYLCGCRASIQILDVATPKTCPVPTGRFSVCGAEAAITEPVVLCDGHLDALLARPGVTCHSRVAKAMLATEQADRLAYAAEMERRHAWKMKEARRQRALNRQAVVYYIRRDSRIKIGTTTNMQARMGSLQPDEILATEPGGRQVERGRHQQFAHLRYRGEWFTPADDLLAHIARVRATHGEPATTTYVPMEAAS